jgi:aminopeptidase N
MAAAILARGAFGPAARAEEPGVSHALAIARAARISDLRYALAFTIKPHQAAVPGSETLSFLDSGSGDLALDYRDGTIATANLNGHAISTELEDGHLTLPAKSLLRGKNELQLAFTSQAAAAGKAITQYQDRDDGNEYVYTLFVPMDASMAFPCFDQPDLKGRFTLKVTAPSEWTVIANTASTSVTKSGMDAVSTFPESRPISTYLFAFTAGPWVNVHPTAGSPNVYVRKSQAARAAAEVPQVQQMATRGIAYLVDYFQQPFPFPKYDFVLIPGFPFGGMEHAGATFLNEDGVLFRTAPTASDYFRRNILVLHETTHQWFGDLVTMRWFDDLWLKEGFAQYMAYKALAELEPAQLPWKHFYEDIKPAAYGIDETQGTTPIFQDIRNLKDAKSAYGAIVYQKAPSVLKQLNYFLGEENFRDGLRMYLKQHAYANAQWADLIGAFEKTGHQDVQTWAKAWILQRGMPEIRVNYSCNASVIDSLTVSQHDVLHEGFVWPIASEWLLGYSDHDKHIRVAWNRPSADGEELGLIGQACPNYILLNSEDYGYGRFLVEGPSQALLTFIAAKGSVGKWMVEQAAHPGPDLYGTPPGRTIAESKFYVDTPLGHSMVWGSLWDSVHVARLAPHDYAKLILDTLPTEEDESLNRIHGARLATALHAYLGPASKANLLPRAEAVLADRMLNASSLNVRIVSFRAFSGMAETPQALSQIKALLDGGLTVPGMPLKPLDRWNLIGHLIAMSDPDAATIYAAEKAKDKSGEGQKYAYAVQAGDPTLANKNYYFHDYFENPTRPEDWITQSLRPFNSWNQSEETAPYLKLALDALPRIKRDRKIFFLGAWLGAFVDGQHSADAQMLVHSWLNEQRDIDPDLRLKVLEVSDALDRTVLIRKTFPE